MSQRSVPKEKLLRNLELWKSAHFAELDLSDRDLLTGLGCILALLQCSLQKNDFARLRLLIPNTRELISNSHDSICARQATARHGFTTYVVDFVDLTIRFKTLGIKPAVIKTFFDSLADYVGARGYSRLAAYLKNLLCGSVIFSGRNWQIYRNHDLAIA